MFSNLLFFLSFLLLSNAALSLTQIRTVFGEDKSTFVYDSAVLGRHEYYQLSRGGTGVTPRPPGCGFANPALLKFSTKTGKLIWATCLTRINDFGRIFFEKGAVAVLSKKPSALTNVVVERVDRATGKLLLPEPRLISTTGENSFGAIPHVSKGRYGKLGVLLDPQQGKINAIPAGAFVNLPFPAFVNSCKSFGRRFSFICVLELSDSSGAKPPKHFLAEINSKSGKVVKYVQLKFLSSLGPDATYVNIFTRVQGRNLWISSVVGSFKQGSSTKSDTLLVAKIDIWTLKPKLTKFIKISAQNFGFFPTITSFGKRIIAIATDIKLDGKGGEYKVDGKIAVKAGKNKRKDLLILALDSRIGKLISAFPIESKVFSIENGATQAHVLKDGTLVVTGKFSNAPPATGGSGFVSLPKVFCRYPFPAVRSCCRYRRRRFCKRFCFAGKCHLYCKF